MLYVLGGGALSGLGNDPGNRIPGLMGACSGSRSQIDEPRMSTRRSVWSRTTQGASPGGPKRRLSGHLASGHGALCLGEGALRRSDPMGPRGPPAYFCPQHEGAGIRMEAGWVQLQAMVVLEKSTDKPPEGPGYVMMLAPVVWDYGSGPGGRGYGTSGRSRAGRVGACQFLGMVGW